VRWVEFDETVRRSGVAAYPVLRDSVNADPIDAVSDSDAPVILLVGRISAYWVAPEALPRLLKAVARQARALVMVDFLDADDMRATPALGSPVMSDVRAIDAGLTTAQVTGRYRLQDVDHAFSERRAFYRSARVEALAKRLAPGHVVRIEAPLVANDPGFTLTMTRARRRLRHRKATVRPQRTPSPIVLTHGERTSPSRSSTHSSIRSATP